MPKESSNQKEQQEHSGTKTQDKVALGMTRRDFSFSVAGTLILAGIAGLKFVDSNEVVRPPGGQDEDRLISACIRCQKCYSVCPQSIIVPTHIEDGILTMRMPTMDYSRGHCDFCVENNEGVPLCVQVCPTEALKLPEDAIAENTVIGKADLVKDLCISYMLTWCQACYDACPYEAIGLDDWGRPFVLTENCNGCGACENACESLNQAAITGRSGRLAITVFPESTIG